MSVSVVVFVLNGLSFIIQFPKGGKLAVNWWGNSVYLDSKCPPPWSCDSILTLIICFSLAADFKRTPLRQVPPGGL